MWVDILIMFNTILLCYFVVLAAGYLLLLIASIRDVFLRFQEVKVGDVLSIMRKENLPPVTVIIAAYNDEGHILNAVYSALKSSYKNTHVIVVNDGSTDNTLSLLINTFKLTKKHAVFPAFIKTSKVKAYYVSEEFTHLVVIDKKHIDRSDSLNVGINACETPLVMTLQSSAVLEPDAISETIFYMMTKPHAVAVGGSAYISTHCTFEKGSIVDALLPYKPIPALQAIEYLRSFVINRPGWNFFGGSLCNPEAFSLFEHQSILEVGGFDASNPASDFEIVTHLHAHKLACGVPYDIGFTPAATAWIDVPQNLQGYWRERVSWQCGLLKSLMLHRELLFNPKYKLIGLFVYPFYLLVETFGAFFECAAYVSIVLSLIFGVLHFYSALLILLVAWFFMLILTMTAVLMSFMTYHKYQRHRDLPWLICMATLECFGFRQYRMFARIYGSFKYLLVGTCRD